MSILESGISLYMPRSTFIKSPASTIKKPRDSVSTHILDELLLELAPKKTTIEKTTGKSAMERTSHDEGTELDAKHRRKQIIAKFQSAVRLQLMMTKQDADNAANSSDATARETAKFDGENSLSRVDNQKPLISSKSAQAFAKSVSSSLGSKFKTSRSSENLNDETMTNLDAKHRSSHTGKDSVATAVLKPTADEKGSRLSLLKKVSSLPRLALEPEHIFNSSYTSLNFDDHHNQDDEESLGDYVESVNASEGTCTTASNTTSSLEQILTHPAYHRSLPETNRHFFEQDRSVSSPRSRSSSRSGRNVSSRLERRESSGQLRRSGKRRTRKHQVVQNEESVRALIDILTADIPSHRKEEGRLKSNVHQENRTKAVSKMSSRSSSLPNLMTSSDGDGLSPEGNQNARWDLNTKAIRQSRLRSSRLRSTSRSNQTQRLPSLPFFDDKSNAIFDLNAGTTSPSRRPPRHRSIRSIANRSLPNLQSLHEESTSRLASVANQNAVWDSHGRHTEVLSEHISSRPSMRSSRSQSVSNLQSFHNDTNQSLSSEGNHNSTSELDTKQRRPSSVGTSRRRTMRSTHNQSLPNLSLFDDDNDDNNAHPDLPLGSHHNSTWELNTKKARPSSVGTPRRRSRRSTSNQSLPNLSLFDDDDNNNNAHPDLPLGSHHNSTWEWNTKTTRPSSVGTPRRRSRKSISMSTSMSTANQSLPNLSLFDDDVHPCLPTGSDPSFTGKLDTKTTNAFTTYSTKRRPIHSKANRSLLSSSWHNTTTCGLAPEEKQDVNLDLDGKGMRPSSMHAPRRRSIRSTRKQRVPNAHSLDKDETKGKIHAICERDAKKDGASSRCRSKRSSSNDSEICSHSKHDAMEVGLDPTNATFKIDGSTVVSRAPSSFDPKSIALDSTQHCADDHHHKKFDSYSSESCLDLLINDVPRRKRRSLKCLGHESLPNLKCFEGIDSRVMWTASQNASWDLDAKREKTKSDHGAIKTTTKRTQSFPNLLNMLHIEFPEQGMTNNEIATSGRCDLAPTGTKTLVTRRSVQSPTAHSSIHHPPPLTKLIEVA